MRAGLANCSRSKATRCFADGPRKVAPRIGDLRWGGRSLRYAEVLARVVLGDRPEEFVAEHRS